MGTLYVVATPIGNMSDISARALTVLREVKFILAEDTRHSGILLKHFNISKPLSSLHKFNELSKSQDILQRITKDNCDAALISDAGTPCISDPGAILVRQAHEKGIKVIGIPGACAMTTAISVSGITADRFTFIGFFPKTKKERENIMLLISNSEVDTFVIYESPLRILETLSILLGKFPEAECAACNDLTKLFEKTVKGSLTSVYNTLKENTNTNKGEYVLVLKRNSSANKAAADPISAEAQIVDCMIKNKIGFKPAIKHLAENKIASKNELYQASLNVKKLLNKDGDINF